MQQAQQQTGDTRGVATAVASAWMRAEDAFARYEAAEAGWAQARSALRVFRPDGRLNDRSGRRSRSPRPCPSSRTTLIQGARVPPGGESLTFLDRLHRQLQEAESNEELREALVRLWWLRRQRPRGWNDGPITGSGHMAHLVQRVVCQRLEAH